MTTPFYLAFPPRVILALREGRKTQETRPAVNRMGETSAIARMVTPGTIVPVRESIRFVREGGRMVVCYAADTPIREEPHDWLHPADMPAGAGRYRLHVTEVLRRHLADLSEADVIAEGIAPDPESTLAVFRRARWDVVYTDARVRSAANPPVVTIRFTLEDMMRDEDHGVRAAA